MDNNTRTLDAITAEIMRKYELLKPEHKLIIAAEIEQRLAERESK